MSKEFVKKKVKADRSLQGETYLTTGKTPKFPNSYSTPDCNHDDEGLVHDDSLLSPLGGKAQLSHICCPDEKLITTI